MIAAVAWAFTVLAVALIARDTLLRLDEGKVRRARAKVETARVLELESQVEEYVAIVAELDSDVEQVVKRVEEHNDKINKLMMRSPTRLTGAPR